MVQPLMFFAYPVHVTPKEVLSGNGMGRLVPSAQGRLSYLLSLIRLRGWAFLLASGGICRFCSALSSSRPGRRGEDSQGQALLPRASQFGAQPTEGIALLGQTL